MKKEVSGEAKYKSEQCMWRWNQQMNQERISPGAHTELLIPFYQHKYDLSWYCADSARSTITQYVEQQYLCCQFFDQCFQSTKTPVFVRKHFKEPLRCIFLISGKDLIKYLSSVLIPITDV